MQNTVVVYTSDHGLLVGQYGLYGKTNATNPANFYEETIRIPLVIHAPGRQFRGAQSRGELVDLLDLHATVLDLATGGKTPRSDYGPGRSLWPLLAGKRTTDWRALQFAERGDSRMVTDGRWKLVRRYQRNASLDPIDTWYDLAHPFGERRASDLPDAAVRGRLMTGLERFFARYETDAHTGRRIWEQPPPNARIRDDVAAN
jgi:arylsulfatase A-like enzyme